MSEPYFIDPNFLYYFFENILICEIGILDFQNSQIFEYFHTKFDIEFELRFQDFVLFTKCVQIIINFQTIFGLGLSHQGVQLAQADETAQDMHQIKAFGNEVMLLHIPLEANVQAFYFVHVKFYLFCVVPKFMQLLLIFFQKLIRGL